jgi:hypothetical protein
MIPTLKHYEYTEDDKKRYPFDLVRKDVNLNDPYLREQFREDPKLKDLGETPGVYLWVMRSADEEFKIYVGKARSLSRRLEDYTNRFQVHSPNDYKLRFFQSFLEEALGDLRATMDLYFLKSTLDEFTGLETKVVKAYGPFINKRSRLGDDPIIKMQNHFRDHYFDIFRNKLGLPVNPASAPE